jgi:MFS family permease
LFPARLPQTGAFTAFRHRDYRLWFGGQLVSLMGTWMQMTAQAYLVFELTHSAAFLGYVALAGGTPSWLLMLYGGVVADRVPKRRLLIMTQSVMMLLAFLLATITWLGRVEPWHVLVLACLLGVVNAFDAPARQSFIIEMVTREDLTNAIALNSSMFNTAAAIGPAIAGILYAKLGPAYCFAVNGGSFVAVVTALLLMKPARRDSPPVHRSPWADLGAGLAYVARESSIRTVILLVGIATLFGMSQNTLFPAWTVRILHGDATTHGLLQSARGIGAVLGALSIAALGRFQRKGRLLLIGSWLFPGCLLGFALTRTLWQSLGTLLAAGASSMLILNLGNALVQTLVRDQFRGRVMSIYSLVFIGSMPLGGMLMGALAERIGEPATVAVGASCLLSMAVLVRWLSPGIAALDDGSGSSRQSTT